MKDGVLTIRSRENCPRGLIASFGDMQEGISTIMKCKVDDVPGFIEAPGGASANVAIAVARLGGKAVFVGKLRDDEVGHRLAGTLSENHVIDEGIYFDKGAGGARAFNLNLDLIRSAEVFHYGSINLIGDPCKTQQLTAMTVAKDAGLLLSYDPQLALWPSPEDSCEQIKSIWDKADLIKVSDEELKLLTGSDNIDDESAMSLVHPNLKLLVVFGDSGCKYYTKNFYGKVEALHVDTVDTTGAGDSFVGALLYKIVEDQRILGDEPRLKDVLKFANACGAITTTKKGAIPALPTMSDVLTLTGGA